jgi:hypothetical protein
MDRQIIRSDFGEKQIAARRLSGAGETAFGHPQEKCKERAERAGGQGSGAGGLEIGRKKPPDSRRAAAGSCGRDTAGRTTGMYRL